MPSSCGFERSGICLSETGALVCWLGGAACGFYIVDPVAFGFTSGRVLISGKDVYL